MPSTNYTLECTICKSRNYKFKRGAEKKSKRIEIKKYCKFCKAHTTHGEVK